MMERGSRGQEKGHGYQEENDQGRRNRSTLTLIEVHLYYSPQMTLYEKENVSKL